MKKIIAAALIVLAANTCRAAQAGLPAFGLDRAGIAQVRGIAITGIPAVGPAAPEALNPLTEPYPGSGGIDNPEGAAVPVSSADGPSLTADYNEIYSALKVYSEIAFNSPQDSPEFLEASAAGEYLRGRLEQGGAAAVPDKGIFDGSQPGEISFRVKSELDDVFGFYRGPETRSTVAREVPIKDGYCRINYVKHNVPFLVQSDSFLNKGEIILTFDDGPGPLTDEVSASMKAGGARALFFVLGRNLGGSAGKERIRTESADGHFVGVHGYNHATAKDKTTKADKPFTAYTTEKIISQLGLVSDMISGATDKKPGFFRPPYGIIAPEALKAAYSDLGLVPVGWTIDTLDWSTKDPEELFQNTISMIKRRGKGIVLLHDIHPQSRTAAKRLVVWLSKNGFKIVSPERLAQAYRAE